MAESNAHKLGQIIGDCIEAAMLHDLKAISAKHDVYLDFKQLRPGVRTNSQPTLTDNNGNKHQLDFVIERDGTYTSQGSPIAFIESAWRNYAKHSKAKAQELEGAILPLQQKYSHLSPFVGAILAGYFTEPSRQQLVSRGFKILYIPKILLAPAFSKFGINILFKESTPESDIAAEIIKFESLDIPQKAALIKGIADAAIKEIDAFIKEVDVHLSRRVVSIVVSPSYSKSYQFITSAEAVEFIEGHLAPPSDLTFNGYMIYAEYNNGSHIRANFKDKVQAIDFLNRVI